MFRAPRKLPKFADLKTILSQSKKTDDPLYQTIQEMIERLSTFQFELEPLIGAFGKFTSNPYQEGVWTPTLISTGGGTAPTYSIQLGKFVRIGALAHCMFDFTLATVAWTAGNVQIAGFPFPCDSLIVGSGRINYFEINTNVYSIGVNLLPGSTVANLRPKTTLSGVTDPILTTASFVATNRLLGSITYKIDG